jgi:hypothetical protein
MSVVWTERRSVDRWREAVCGHSAPGAAPAGGDAPTYGVVISIGGGSCRVARDIAPPG